MGLFSKKTGDKSYLGVDIGGSSVKLVELLDNKGRAQLLTYGYLERSTKSATENLLDKPTEMADSIKKIAEKSKVQTKDAITALPASSVFTTILYLTDINKKDLTSIKKVTEAVQAEAEKVLPLPLDEMVLDWKVLNGGGSSTDPKAGVQVLLTAAAKTLVKKYIDIFKKAGFNLLSLETESFGMARALVGKDKSTVIIVDIGAANTDITIVDNGIPYMERTVDIGGYQITKILAETMNISIDQAEQFKRDLANYSSQVLNQGQLLPESIEKSLVPIINEIKYLLDFFGKQPGNEAKRIDRLILSGGTAKIFNLTEYFTKMFNIRTFLGDPWARVLSPEDLKPALDAVGSRLAVCIGLAMRDIEK
ncbi:hypothetical protein A2533_03310 [Candidatus Falkowbacteria bacterium RIFOXYD2_FULL_35_9]|uniref:SHS2 domain-containing protein n=1 Tax=Candidatus Falkowbacteria bacterium RIFOXYC2_FULL_36_12 TaxID=1798002 RepID=A0A1F5SYD5_9BACT|nr:MAG: hypothetical protein A2300_02125 [Candidatus Falkowbacteria bacterium RIFOXYB2_FULL_35_7]OGF31735.1 MAG: hypothetical protein A2478_04590 [Candidatus Falkowbacteria bacterium RIFOXYC2_FULL_36_12]OGF34070.1 MAG: hypothetical protein A2223_04350 [Candidatus Falkowbacteria bacterium RIFOXYA2_FULL_35_8]OGF47735.1 MAG: hypothetical protein A2533_03310 [Candidatus Falkowbacteria bacterium RIFOXYD2_FULL_35_9]